MFDPMLGRWIHPPADTPIGFTPEDRIPAWLTATGPAQIIARPDDSIEVRSPQGGTNGIKPTIDVRVLDAEGRELAHYTLTPTGDKVFLLGAGHTLTIGPNGKVVDPPGLPSPDLQIHPFPDANNAIGFVEADGWTTKLDPIPLPPGVPGKALYAHDSRLILLGNDNKYHWVDATPQTLPPTPAERSLNIPWDREGTDHYIGPDGTPYYNVNGHKVAFSPDLQRVIDPTNGLRPLGPIGMWLDDRGTGPQSWITAAFPIPSKQLPLPPGVPALALYQLQDFRLVIIDQSGASHYVSPLPALPPQGWSQGFLQLFMNVAMSYGGRRGGLPRVLGNSYRAVLDQTDFRGRPKLAQSTKVYVTTEAGRQPGAVGPRSLVLRQQAINSRETGPTPVASANTISAPSPKTAGTLADRRGGATLTGFVKIDIPIKDFFRGPAGWSGGLRLVPGGAHMGVLQGLAGKASLEGRLFPPKHPSSRAIGGGLEDGGTWTGAKFNQSSGGGRQQPSSGSGGWKRPGSAPRPLDRGGELEQQVRDQLVGTKVKAGDVGTILDNLANHPAGKELAEAIASGRFKDATNFSSVVSNLARYDVIPGSLEQIRLAGRLLDRGITDIVFEVKQGGHEIKRGVITGERTDLDLMARDQNGDVHGWQFKDVQSNNPKKVIGKVFQEMRQLTDSGADVQTFVLDTSVLKVDLAPHLVRLEQNYLKNGIQVVIRTPDGIIFIPLNGRFTPEGTL
ncbi:hypothetical protein [Nocardia crassostreae]|uniref:hypothetical protein n=1 Tax=Nocardia crassostreae TaxID=53428 RepID=UPI000A788C93|nr:hypothetical protein [Nocardia crassostreae]